MQILLDDPTLAMNSEPWEISFCTSDTLFLVYHIPTPQDT